MLPGQLAMTGQRLISCELPPDDATAELARDLFADRLRVFGA
jgi:hypothetical protein